MREHNVQRLVFSSSAAVYGAGVDEGVSERAVPMPESPYGRSKLMAEWMIRDAAAAWALSAVSLRYFNVVGCADPLLEDSQGSNLFPCLLRALGNGEAPTVFGADYPTPDGTCIRDYVHVEDLAAAHVAAANLVDHASCNEVVNIGCGRGHSVLEVLRAFGEASGLDLTPVFADRRPGDTARVTADVSRARTVLGWEAKHGLRSMVDSSWEAAAERVLQERRRYSSLTSAGF
jgi:UDP-glucose 4-epimerase